MSFSDYSLIASAVNIFERLHSTNITEVVCGLAKGADIFGKKWAICDAKIPVKDFPADWSTHGKAAGPIRNGEMADYADGLIIFIWDGSRGSANMLEQMKQRNKPFLSVYNGDISNMEYGP
jgi:hypothetical protein